MKKNHAIESDDMRIVDNLEEVSWEEMMDIMCGPLVRDQHGNEVTDPEVLKKVHEAMGDHPRFECGGLFKEILKEKSGFKEKYGSKHKKKKG
jgi:hypothetical protein